jgi:hypothetical protein
MATPYYTTSTAIVDGIPIVTDRERLERLTDDLIGSPTINPQHLSSTQRTLLKYFLADKKSLIGYRLSLVADSKNVRIPSVTVMVVGFGDEKTPVFKVLNEATDDIYTANLWQLEIIEGGLMPISKNKIPNGIDKKVDKLMNGLILGNLTTVMNNKINQHYISQVNNTKSLSTNIKASKDNIIKMERDLETTLNNLENAKRFTLSSRKLSKELALLKKHDKIDDVYISNQGSIFVKTKSLKRTSPDTGKVKQFGNIGSFLMRLSYDPSQSRFLNVFNLDYTDGEYDHPNIQNGDVCMGNNESEIRAMYNNCQLYQLVDFLVMFFSVYPQDEHASPHIDFDDWWGEKSRRTQPLPDYMREEKLA